MSSDSKTSTTKIDFVYFDLGNILVTFDPDKSCENLAGLFGVTSAAANDALYKSGLEDRYEHGEVSDEELADQLRSKLGQAGSDVSTRDVSTRDVSTRDVSTRDVSTRDVSTRNVSTHDVSTHEILDAVGDMFQPIESMAQTIRDVLATGMRIGILSNTCAAHWDWVIRQGWSATAGPFEQTILSFEVGSMKPDSKIYAAAETAAGVSPDRILFVDDRAENVAAAQQRGWNAVECLGGEPATAVLREFAIIS